MRPHPMTALIAACALALMQVPALAEDIYRWTDEDGTVHFGSLPPQGVDYELISSVTPAQPAASSATPNPGSEPEAEEKKSPAQLAREERQQRREEQRREQALLEPQCAAMRQQLEQVEPHTRVIVQDEDGEVRRLEDDERLEMVNEAKAFIAANCQDIP